MIQHLRQPRTLKEEDWGNAQAKIDELVDAVNALEETVYRAPDDAPYDGCCDCNCDCHDLDDDAFDDADDMLTERRPFGETYFVTKDDGALFEIVKMCVNHPDIRLGQAIVNVSGFAKIVAEDKDGKQRDLWQWNGPAKEAA